MKKSLLIMAGAGLLLLALAGCGGGGSGADPAKGQALYKSGGSAGIPCDSCHTLDGSKLVGPTLQGIAARAATRIDGMSAEDYIRQSITDPGAYVVDGFNNQMPDIFGKSMSEQDVNDLVAYLMTQ